MKKLFSREPTPEILEKACGKYADAQLIGRLVGEALWDAAPALPEPGEVEKGARSAADWLRNLGAGPDANRVDAAADLIAAQKAEIDRISKIEGVRDRAGIGDGSVHDAVVALHGALISSEAETEAEVERLRGTDWYVMAQREKQMSGAWEREARELKADNERLLTALCDLVEVCPCDNGCAPDDMTCATMKARATINAVKEKNNAR